MASGSMGNSAAGAAAGEIDGEALFQGKKSILVVHSLSAGLRPQPPRSPSPSTFNYRVAAAPFPSFARALRCPDLASQKTMAIVGGGLSGLACAKYLSAWRDADGDWIETGDTARGRVGEGRSQRPLPMSNPSPRRMFMASCQLSTHGLSVMTTDAEPHCVQTTASSRAQRTSG